ncbi:MAG: amino acid carrier protein [Waddliaceae bacterium]
MINLTKIEDFAWDFTGVPLLLILGIYITWKSRFFQIRKMGTILKIFIEFFGPSKGERKGIHPIKLFLASVGGCVGIGNIVGICTAVQLGGPGALLWIWVTAIFGMILKYAEVYLGVKYRISDQSGGYTGGPMIFIKKITSKAWVPFLISFLLCIYGIEIYQFRVIIDNITENWHGANHFLVTIVLLFSILYAVNGGIKRVANIASAIVPLFVFLFLGMGLWILVANIYSIPSILKMVFTEAFTGSAALGGFAGSTLIMTISHGIRRASYSGDIGIGYASVIHSETSCHTPQKQATLAIVGIVLDTFIICTMSVLLILISGAWHENIPASIMVQRSLESTFPFMWFFMPFFMLLLGYSTINAYFIVGIKCAQQISPEYGRGLYFSYAIFAFLAAAYLNTEEAQAIMAIAQVMLVVINGYAIYKLRNHISYDLEETPTSS